MNSFREQGLFGLATGSLASFHWTNRKQFSSLALRKTCDLLRPPQRHSFSAPSMSPPTRTSNLVLKKISETDSGKIGPTYQRSIGGMEACVFLDQSGQSLGKSPEISQGLGLRLSVPGPWVFPRTAKTHLVDLSTGVEPYKGVHTERTPKWDVRRRRKHHN